MCPRSCVSLYLLVSFFILRAKFIFQGVFFLVFILNHNLDIVLDYHHAYWEKIKKRALPEMQSLIHLPKEGRRSMFLSRSVIFLLLVSNYNASVHNLNDNMKNLAYQEGLLLLHVPTAFTFVNVGHSLQHINPLDLMCGVYYCKHALNVSSLSTSCFFSFVQIIFVLFSQIFIFLSKCIFEAIWEFIISLCSTC